MGCDARSHNCLGRNSHSCSNLPSTRESEWKCWSHGVARSKDAKLGVAFRDSHFLEGRSEEILLRELERVQQPQSLPAAHRGSTGLCQQRWQATAPGASPACRGWDHLWDPSSSNAMAGKAAMQFVGAHGWAVAPVMCPVSCSGHVLQRQHSLGNHLPTWSTKGHSPLGRSCGEPSSHLWGCVCGFVLFRPEIMRRWLSRVS